MKPHLYRRRGIWYCEGVSGYSPKHAYDNWTARKAVWNYVPGGYVPRLGAPWHSTP